MRYARAFCFLAVIMFGALRDAPTTQASVVYWANPNYDKIYQVNSDGTNLATVRSGLGVLDYDVAADLLGGKVYWSENNLIRRANLDGSGVPETFYTDSGNVNRMEIASGKLYWTSSTYTVGIQRKNLDGSGAVEEVIPYTSFVDNFADGLAIDSAGGKIYWGNSGARGGDIQRANLDGTDVETIVSQSLSGSGVEGIALDPGNGKIYWSEWGSLGSLQFIKRADLDGTNAEILPFSFPNQLSAPSDIDLDLTTGKLFWSNSRGYNLNWISKANLDGSNVQVVTSYNGSSVGIDVVIPEPSTFILATAGLLGLLGRRWSKRRRQQSILG